MKKKKRKLTTFIHVYASNNGKNNFPLLQNIEFDPKGTILQVSDITFATLIIKEGKKVKIPIYEDID